MRMLDPAYPVLLQEEVANMPMAARSLLVINTIFVVDWEATFQGVKVVATGAVSVL